MNKKKNKFNIDDIVVCIRSIDDENGGPKEGVIYKVISIDEKIGQWIGIELPTYDPKFNIAFGHSNYTRNIQTGEMPNWGVHCFRYATPEEVNFYNYPDKLEKLLNECI
jgi:hypothetical protein